MLYVVLTPPSGDFVFFTIIFQTHNVALAAPIADYIISIDANGVAHAVGTDFSAVLADSALAHEIEQEQDEVELEKEVIDTVKKEGDQPDGKLILAEEIAQGRVTWKSIMLFLKGLGGDKPVFFLIAWTLGITLMHGGNMFAVWFLGFWGSQYETHAPEDIRVTLCVCVVLYLLGVELSHFNTAICHCIPASCSRLSSLMLPL